MGEKLKPLDIDDDRQMRKFFRKLRQRDDVVDTEKVYVDVPGTVYRRVACTDGLCMAHGRGRALSGKTCCTTFDVPVTQDDVEQVAKVVDEVRKIRDVNRAIEKADGWWRIDDKGFPYLNERPSGACVFLSAAKGERPWCTIHEYCVGADIDFRKHKPEGCCLFPLYFVEWGGRTLVTSYGTDYMKRVEPDQADMIQRFDCLHPPKGKGRSILVDQQEELGYRLGKPRWDRVLAKLAEAGHELV